MPQPLCVDPDGLLTASASLSELAARLTEQATSLAAAAQAVGGESSAVAAAGVSASVATFSRAFAGRIGGRTHALRAAAGNYTSTDEDAATRLAASIPDRGAGGGRTGNVPISVSTPPVASPTNSRPGAIPAELIGPPPPSAESPVAVFGAPTRTRIENWSTTIERLYGSSEAWRPHADTLAATGDAYVRHVSTPGGTDWDGDAAETASESARADRGVVWRAGDLMRDNLATVAGEGASSQRQAQNRALRPSATPRWTTSPSPTI